MNIHIANGFSVCGQIYKIVKSAGDAVILFADGLSFGPVLPLDNLSIWQRQRNAYISAMADYTLTNIEAILNAKEKIILAKHIYIWSGHWLDEQLFLVFFVNLLLSLGIDARKIINIHVTENIHGKKILSLDSFPEQGFLSVIGNIASLSPITSNELDEMRRIWDVIISSDPSDMQRFFAHKVTANNCDNINLLKRRYPIIGVGLNQLDLQLLKICSSQELFKLINVRYTVDHVFDSDYSGGLFVEMRLHRLAKLTVPLIEIIESDEDEVMNSVKITKEGKDVLLGKLNQIDLNGYDDWIGGVHLQSPPSPIWYYVPDEDTLVLSD